MKLNYLTRGAIIAAVYAALTLVNPFGYEQVQVRISEALTVLPFFEPAAIPGLFVGCLIANLRSPFGLLDIIGGSLLTLIAAYLTWRIKKLVLALLPPVLINAFGVALIIKIVAEHPWAYLLIALSVGIGQAIAVYGLGYPLLLFMLKRKLFIREEVFQKKMGGIERWS